MLSESRVILFALQTCQCYCLLISNYWTNEKRQVCTTLLYHGLLRSQKKLSETRGYKKAAIASMHKLIRTIYALIINDQPYNYHKTLRNQR